MTRRSKKSRAYERQGPHMYQRERDGTVRWYACFRSLPGGRREALCEPGSRSATTDKARAAVLFGERLAVLQEEVLAFGAVQPVRAPNAPPVVAPEVAAAPVTIGRAVEEYLAHLTRTSEASKKWQQDSAKMLHRAVAYYGDSRPIARIGKLEVQEFIGALRTMAYKPHRVVQLRNGETEARPEKVYSDQSRRHHLAVLLRLLDYAEDREWIRASPRSRLRGKGDRPKKPRSKTPWLENDEAARLLEAARTLPRSKREPMWAMAEAILGTLLLTGGRADEVLGLTRDDIDFVHRQVHFRPTPFRKGQKGKTDAATRTVPLWPQLEEILRRYLAGVWEPWRQAHRPDLWLLFPAPRILASRGREARITDIRKAVEATVRAANHPRLRGDGRVIPEEVIGSRATRITYCTARAVTTDAQGKQIAMITLMDEMGHTSLAMAQAVYLKVSRRPLRGDVVEYRLASTPASSETNPETQLVRGGSR